MFFLEYPVTQPLTLSRVKILAIFVGAVVYIAFITTINVVAVGYELVPISSNDYNASYTLWYEKLFPAAWIPDSRTCQPAVIKLNER